MKLCLCFAFFILSTAKSARILGIFPTATYSHYTLGRSLMQGLASRGHEVTMVSPYSEKVPIKNYTEVILTGFSEELEVLFDSMDLYKPEAVHPILYDKVFNDFGIHSTEQLFNHTNVQKLLKSKDAFDVVIAEQFLNDAIRGFAFYFNAPSIMFSPVGPSHWTNPAMGNPAPPSYVTSVHLSYNGRMNFFQRVENFLLYLSAILTKEFYSDSQQNSLLHKYFPEAPHISDLYYNTSFVLLNSHISTNQPVALVPNMLEIGGFHVYPPKKLPQDLQEYLDSATEGVVYFSMGSCLKSKLMSTENRDIFLNTFRKLKLKVLWKWEEDKLPGQPTNVKLGKWLPQQDILAHPNVKLFLTHGGLLSTTEAVYHGVPIVSIPVYGDQDLNAAQAKANGFGLTVSYHQLTEDKLQSAINEVLANPKYRDTARRRSKLMHDRPMKPLDSAIYWVEYVIRHKGAPHFRSTALDLTWYQYLSLDVIAFLGLIVLAVCKIIYMLCTKIKRLCQVTNKATTQKKVN